MQELLKLFYGYDFWVSVVLIYLTLFFVKKIFPTFWEKPIPNKIISAVMPEVLGLLFFWYLHKWVRPELTGPDVLIGGLASGYLAPKAYYLLAIVEKAISTFKAPGKDVPADTAVIDFPVGEPKKEEETPDEKAP